MSTKPEGVIVMVPTPLVKFGALAVTVAVPMLASACTKIPVIVVVPSGIVTISDPDPAASKCPEIRSFVRSLLVSVTWVPPEGDGCGSAIVIGDSKFCPTDTLVTEMPPEGATALTVTLAVVSAMAGRALACIVATPAVTPVTGTIALVAFATKVIVEGTVATAGMLELKLRIKPPGGAGADKFNVRFCVAPPSIERLAGEKVAARPTVTG
jgi:hypothetical protein